MMILADSVRTKEVVTTRRTSSQFVQANGSNVTALTDVTVTVFIENLCNGKNAENQDNAKRICFVGMAAGLGSSFVSIMLIQLDLLIPCIGYIKVMNFIEKQTCVIFNLPVEKIGQCWTSDVLNDASCVLVDNKLLASKLVQRRL